MEGKPSITIEYPTIQLRVIDSIEYKPFIYFNIISLTFPKILNIYYNLNPKNPKSCEIIFLQCRSPLRHHPKCYNILIYTCVSWR